MTAADQTTLLCAPDGATARVTAHGAHVLSWHPAPGDGEDRLYLSPLAAFDEGAAIRGGVPVIFPQFAGEGPLAKHAFARRRRWTLSQQADDRATWRLRDDAESRAAWPHAFDAALTVCVGSAALEVTLHVEARGGAEAGPLAFTAALHTYLRVHDAAAAEVHGLLGARYRDTARGDARDAAPRVESAEAVRFGGEVDRIYLEAPPVVTLRDGTRTIRLEQDGFADTVVWNPGPVVARGLADVEPDGWRRFVCVEAAAIGRPIRLHPGEAWTGVQRLIAGR